MDIYTIGHSNYSLERLIEMLERYNIDCVVDIRGVPYSAYNVQFNKEMLKASLEREGFKYIYMAKEFAAQRENEISYNKDGYADFEKVINEYDFLNGIERLKSGINKGYKIALLGAMQEPIRCHRGILVGRFLRDNGFNVKHILDNDLLATQGELENQLLDKYFLDRNQITIDNLLGSNINEEDMIEEGYRIANKEIGERLKKD